MKSAPTRRGVARSSPASGHGRWLLAGGLLLPVTFVMSMDRTAMTVVAPVFARDFHLSVTQLSIVLTSFWWAYALFQVPGGLLARRFGPRKMLALAGLWWSAFTFITPYGVLFLGFVVIRLLLGIGQAADWPASVLTLQRWFPQREQSRGNSLLLCGLYLGSIVGTPLVVWITDVLGWAAVFHLFAAVGVVLAALWWWLVRDEPRAHPWVSAEEAAYIESGKAPARGGPALRWQAFARSPQFWAIGLQYAFLIIIQSFFTTWLPTYLVEARGVSFTAMGWLGSLPWIALVAGVFGMGTLNDRVLRRWPGRVRAAAAGYLVAAVFLVLGAFSSSVPLMMVFLCLSLGSVGTVQIQVWAACQDLGGDHGPTVAGWTNLWGNLMSAAGPLFTGLLVGIGGNWTLALVSLAAAGVLGSVCWAFVHPERPLRALGAA
ncbi:MFS transporter [Amycolatopsis saalfeldensis]|uniref:MFS transporter, ACS family, glucarate transporter n=1 Tax=Amycolatopsis saalfeldensis TaxID=394193 RepID=A0A1H8XXX4_9PSEU|nr:MFS transporter [Amycolatopsis saalfeldensis]SEP44612.1 MFS transporter, ACS family, glucarate transporter [Amycolatopsis saalfeldensis]